MCVSPFIVDLPDGSKCPVPCGKCIECLSDWSNDWSFRLWQECKRTICPVHLTLTFDPEFVPVAYNEEVGEWQSYVCKRDVQLFLKRLRKMCPEFKNNLRYFAVGEYGGSDKYVKGGHNRAHYHLILISPCITSVYQYANAFRRAWSDPQTGKSYGFIKLKFAARDQIGYLCGYLNKLDKSPHITPPFKLFSKSIGLCYLTEKVVEYFFRTFATGVKNQAGYWQRLPRYYRKKLDQLSVNHPYLSRCGMTFSDVVRSQKFEAKGIQAHFDYFCRNFNDIAREVIKKEVSYCRRYGYSLPEHWSTQHLFVQFCKFIPEVAQAQADSYNKIDEIKVRHKFTKLYKRDLEKVSYNESFIQHGFRPIQKEKPIQSEPRIPPNYGFWPSDSDFM